MESKGVIFEGKTLDDAVKKGLEALGLARAEVMIQVMEEGSSGFLGIGARPYRVRMMPRPRRELAERPERRSGRDRGDRGGRERSGGGRGGERGERRPRGERESRGPRTERAGRPERAAHPERPREPRPERVAQGTGAGARRDEVPPQEPRREEGPGESGTRRRRRRRGGRNGGDRPREVAPVPAHATAGARESEGPEPMRESAHGNGSLMPADELAAAGRRLAEDLFKAMGFEAQVSAHAEGDSVEVKAEIGQDSDLITGEKGEVRQSIQHILNRMLNRGGSSRYHLQLEINDFWAQRENELREMARRLADEAVADEAEKLTEYLNAQERRVVHVALRDDSRVRTFGLGDGLIKKVAIAPAGPESESESEAELRLED